MDLMTASKQMALILQMFKEATPDELVMYRRQLKPIAEQALDIAGIYIQKTKGH
jgi:hypothetical protein